MISPDSLVSSAGADNLQVGRSRGGSLNLIEVAASALAEVAAAAKSASIDIGKVAKEVEAEIEVTAQKIANIASKAIDVVNKAVAVIEGKNKHQITAAFDAIKETIHQANLALSAIDGTTEKIETSLTIAQGKIAEDSSVPSVAENLSAKRVAVLGMRNEMEGIKLAIEEALNKTTTLAKSLEAATAFGLVEVATAALIEVKVHLASRVAVAIKDRVRAEDKAKVEFAITKAESCSRDAIAAEAQLIIAWEILAEAKTTAAIATKTAEEAAQQIKTAIKAAE